MKKGTKPVELLAPAGGPQVARAAFQYGADAIYLGLTRFSARADAENFTLDNLREVVGFAHSRAPSRRVYVTFNTLVRPGEMREAADLLFRLQECGVDAVILQDAGLLRIARRELPSLRLHASTQMAIHNLDGALQARDDGFSRVTLARELTLPEIETIAGASGLEVEVFIHGALCYAYSGLCLISSRWTGRSGNRGQCAYCCRGAFSSGPDRERGGLPFSMKDLALGESVEALRAAGVASLKIEGRMKNALYVAAVTDYYRRRLDPQNEPCDWKALEEDLQTIFARPWTSLFAGKHRSESPAVDAQQVGHRGARIGEVQAVVGDLEGPALWLEFTSSRALERHDGLQIDLPGVIRPFGFAVSDLRRLDSSDRRSQIGTPAGARVAVLLPENPPPLPRGAPVYCSSSQAVKKRYPVENWRAGQYRSGLRMDVQLSVQPDLLRIEGEVQGPSGDPVRADCTQAGSYPPARQPGALEPAVQAAFARLGDTRWLPGTIAISNPENRFVPASVLNAARREIATGLETAYETELKKRLDAAAAAWRPEHPPALERPESWCLRIENADVLDSLTDDELRGLDEAIWVLPTTGLESVPARLTRLLTRMGGADRVRVALPLLARREEPARLEEGVRMAAEQGVVHWEVAHLYGMSLLRRTGLAVASCSADWSVYAINGAAIRQAFASGFSRITLSPELGREDRETLLGDFGDRAAVIVFQDMPLMISETAPWGRPEAGETLLSGAGHRMQIRPAGTRHWILDENPFSLVSQLESLRRAGGRIFRVDLAWKNRPPEAQAALWREIRSGRWQDPEPSARVPVGMR